MRTSKTALLVLSLALLLTALGPAEAKTGKSKKNDFVVRAPHAEIHDIAKRRGLKVIELTSVPAGDPAHGVYRVRAKSSASPKKVIQEVTDHEFQVTSIEAVGLAALPSLSQGVGALGLDPLQAALDETKTTYFGGEADSLWMRQIWQGYVDQPAALVTDASAMPLFHFRGGATVAVIDTGIDPDHPLFEGRLLPGYDFVRDQPSASEWNDLLDQSTMAILGQSTMAILGQSTMAILGGEELIQINQSTMAILGGDQADQLDPSVMPPFFGHGTMVAGMVHRVAPEASLMPLKAFDSFGTGDLVDVIEAIYYAVDQGADVINMSFSLSSYSAELEAALEYANDQGVLCISAVGNDGSRAEVYPAAFPTVIGVASTDLYDQVSVFSNFGPASVTIAAPGEHLITSYPGGGWAVVAGTSFAAPWVAGATALMAEKSGWYGYPSIIDFTVTLDVLSEADPVSGLSGLGRLDIKSSMTALYQY